MSVATTAKDAECDHSVCYTVPLPEFETFSGSTSSGICHFGFLVEDVKETRRRLQEAGAWHIAEPLPGLVHAEDKWKGPDGMLFDMTDQARTGALPLGKE
jgi:hypothetical protein